MRKVGLYIGRDPVEGSGEADAKVDLIPVKFNVARQFRGYLRFEIWQYQPKPGWVDADPVRVVEASQRATRLIEGRYQPLFKFLRAGI